MVEALDHGQRFDMDIFLFQSLGAALESLFDDETHSFEGGSGLFDQLQCAESGIAMSQKVVDEENVVVRSEKIVTDTDFIITVFGEGVNRGGQGIAHGFR